VKKKKKRNPKHIKCLNCETRGHKIQNCPEPRKKVFFSYEWKISISFTFKYKSRLGWEFNISTPSSVWKLLAPCLIVCWNYTRVYQNYVTRKIRSPSSNWVLIEIKSNVILDWLKLSIDQTPFKVVHQSFAKLHWAINTLDWHYPLSRELHALRCPLLKS
jgi:hypothetical protein